MRAERALRERWEIPKAARRPVIERLLNIINDPKAGHREVTGAIKALLSASKINLANVQGSIKALEFADLKPKLKEIQRMIEERGLVRGRSSRE